MKVNERDFSAKTKKYVEEIKAEMKEKYDLSAGNNICLIFEKLDQLRDLPGTFVECGVYQGNTFFSAATYCRNENIERPLYGFDSFSGFPFKETDERDRPGYFKILFKDGLITKEHYEKAAVRTKDFTDETHLSAEYFMDVKKVFGIADDFKNAILVEGPFDDTLNKFKEKIAILYLDCDLYQSYMDCLNSLYPSLVSGGVVIFDEYYSLKYPGARLAVIEFFKEKGGYFEMYQTEEGFERWCYVKE
jgi:hypothetical protein